MQSKKSEADSERAARALSAASVLLAASALALAPLTAGAQAQLNVDELLMRVGERVADFYKRAKNVICIETSNVQPIDSSYSSQGFARTVESELRIEIDGGQAPAEAAIVRKVRKVNGRAPREQDKKERAGCTDPTPCPPNRLRFCCRRIAPSTNSGSRG